MVRAHRQAWTWQDEWFNLTMDDIRELERQTQAALAKKMGSANSSTDEPDEQDESPDVTPSSSQDAVDKALQQQHHQLQPQSQQQHHQDSSGSRTPVSPVGPPSWPMSCISESSSSDDDEFFDCQDWRSSGGALSPAMVRWSSMELIPQGEEADEMEPTDKTQEDRLEVSFGFLIFLLSFCLFYIQSAPFYLFSLLS